MQGAVWHRAARRDEVRILARACGVSAVVLAAVVVRPYAPTTPRLWLGLVALLAATIGVALQLLARRVRAWHVHAVLVVATTAVSACIAMAATPTGAVIVPAAYLWITTFSAVFHRRRVLMRHLALVGVGSLIGLSLADVPSALLTWAILTANAGVVAMVLNGRVLDLRREATTDPLTGVLTRRAFTRAAEVEMARAARTGQPLTLALLDLDDFKVINDREGHTAGDAVLVGLTTAWRAALRPEDLLGRYGGDEFVLVLPGTDRERAAAVLERLESDLCAWSAGVAEWTGEDLTDWIAEADRDLYAAKTDTERDVVLPETRDGA